MLPQLNLCSLHAEAFARYQLDICVDCRLQLCKHQAQPSMRLQIFITPDYKTDTTCCCSGSILREEEGVLAKQSQQRRFLSAKGSRHRQPSCQTLFQMMSAWSCVRSCTCQLPALQLCCCPFCTWTASSSSAAVTGAMGPLQLSQHQSCLGFYLYTWYSSGDCTATCHIWLTDKHA